MYRSNLYRNIRYIEPGIKCLVPCTALSVVKILEACQGCFDRTQPIKQQLKRHTITIINRSEIVGRPLAAMLANDGANVYSVDIDSIYQFAGNRSSKCESSTVEDCVRKVRTIAYSSLRRVFIDCGLHHSTSVFFVVAVVDSDNRSAIEILSPPNRMDSPGYNSGECGEFQERR